MTFEENINSHVNTFKMKESQALYSSRLTFRLLDYGATALGSPNGSLQKLLNCYVRYVS